MASPKELFYKNGLAFQCQRCSACCRHEPGFVFLSQVDLDALCKETKLEEDEFIAVYGRWVPWEGELEILSLKEKANNDCIFWGDEGCAEYASRPYQCSSYPFWGSILRDKKTWEDCARDCPGIGKGAIIAGDVIESLLDERSNHPYITRDRSFDGVDTRI